MLNPFEDNSRVSSRSQGDGEERREGLVRLHLVLGGSGVNGEVDGELLVAANVGVGHEVEEGLVATKSGGGELEGGNDGGLGKGNLGGGSGREEGRGRGRGERKSGEGEERGRELEGERTFLMV